VIEESKGTNQRKVNEHILKLQQSYPGPGIDLILMLLGIEARQEGSQLMRNR
jgi:hypothetical protein